MAKRFTAYVHGTDPETGMNTSVPHVVVLATDYDILVAALRQFMEQSSFGGPLAPDAEVKLK